MTFLPSSGDVPLIHNAKVRHPWKVSVLFCVHLSAFGSSAKMVASSARARVIIYI